MRLSASLGPSIYSVDTKAVPKTVLEAPLFLACGQEWQAGSQGQTRLETEEALSIQKDRIRPAGASGNFFRSALALSHAAPSFTLFVRSSHLAPIPTALPSAFCVSYRLGGCLWASGGELASQGVGCGGLQGGLVMWLACVVLGGGPLQKTSEI